MFKFQNWCVTVGAMRERKRDPRITDPGSTSTRRFAFFVLSLVQKKRRTEALAPFLAAIAAAAKEEQDEKLADSVALKKKLDKEREDQRLAGMTKAERVKYFKKKEEDEKKAMIKKMSKTVKR